MISDNVINTIRTWQKMNEVVVLATGVFDILHIEHIRFLKKAKAIGSKLVVGIESDIRTQAIKGLGRPLNHESIRLEQVAALNDVDLAFILPQQFSTQADWESFMDLLHPDIYAASSHSNFQENKRQICEKYDISFKVVHGHNPDVSTTQIIESIKSQQS